jgi:ribosomal-protein-alanine N-acetyltransferase
MIIAYSCRFTYREEEYVVRDLLPGDVSADYVDWLNNEQNRAGLWIASDETITTASQRMYVEKINESSDRAIAGLFNVAGDLIGTAGWHHVNKEHKHPSLGILIGNLAYRGRGLGGVWVWVNTQLLFAKFNAVKVTAGALASNRPSLRSFLKAGYQLEGTLREEVYREGSGWSDLLILGCLVGELKNSEDIAMVEVSLNGL